MPLGHELRVLLIGVGGTGSAHQHAWSVQSGVRIAAICDRNGSAATEAARAVLGAAAFTSAGAAIEQGAYDIVDICVPPEYHCEITLAALRSGAHVLCDKPLAPSTAEAREMVEMANDRERLLMTGFLHRFHPPVLQLREMMENDDIGAPVSFRWRFSGEWRPEAEQSAGETGVLAHTAVHGIDLFRILVGEPERVSAVTAQFNPELRSEDTAIVTMQTASGAVGVVEAGWSSPGSRNILEIYGTAGACIIDYEAGGLRTVTADQPVWVLRDDSGPNRFERALSHFADAVRGLVPLDSTGLDGLRAAEICDLARRDAAR